MNRKFLTTAIVGAALASAAIAASALPAAAKPASRVVEVAAPVTTAVSVPVSKAAAPTAKAAAPTAKAAAPAPAATTSKVGSISGRIVDTKGAVLADAHVTIYPKNVINGSVAGAQTDAAGKFSVAGLKAGAYKVDIDAGGWFEWAPGRRTSDSTAGVYQVTSKHNTVVNSTVTAAGIITGQVTDANGQVAAGVAVSAENDANARGWYATTAADGSYSFKVDPSGSYVLGFKDGGVQQFSPATLDRAAATRYTVGSGRTLAVNERLLAAPRLTGRLTDATGAPAAGATVRYVTENATEFTTTTDADGRYTFDKATPGDVKVEFTTATGQTQWAHQKADYDDADSVTLTIGATTTVDDQLLPAN